MNFLGNIVATVITIFSAQPSTEIPPQKIVNDIESQTLPFVLCEHFKKEVIFSALISYGNNKNIEKAKRHFSPPEELYKQGEKIGWSRDRVLSYYRKEILNLVIQSCKELTLPNMTFFELCCLMKFYDFLCVLASFPETNICQHTQTCHPAALLLGDTGEHLTQDQEEKMCKFFEYFIKKGVSGTTSIVHHGELGDRLPRSTKSFPLIAVAIYAGRTKIVEMLLKTMPRNLLRKKIIYIPDTTEKTLSEYAYYCMTTYTACKKLNQQHQRIFFLLNEA